LDAQALAALFWKDDPPGTWSILLVSFCSFCSVTSWAAESLVMFSSSSRRSRRSWRASWIPRANRPPQYAVAILLRPHQHFHTLRQGFMPPDLQPFVNLHFPFPFFFALAQRACTAFRAISLRRSGDSVAGPFGTRAWPPLRPMAEK
jgi:hypothetical protein